MSEQNQGLLWKLGLITQGFDSKIEDAGAKLGLWKSKWDAAFQIVKGSAVIGFLDKLIDRGGQIKDTAEQMEMTTDSLQAMDFAAKQAGVNVNTLHGAYNILAGKAAEAATGNKEVSKALETLGISSAAFIAMPVDRQLEAIAVASANATDQNKAFAAVADLIGTKNAPRLNSVLKQLAAEGLDGVVASARAAGQVMSEEVIADFDYVGDKWTELKDRLLNTGSALLGKILKLGEGLGYAAANIVNKFDGIATEWAVLDEVPKRAAEAVRAVEQVNIAIIGTKATTEELARFEAARAKASEEAALATMDAAQKLQYFNEKLLAHGNAMLKFSHGTKEYIREYNAMMEAQSKITEIQKDQAEAASKEAKEQADLLAKQKAEKEQLVKETEAHAAAEAKVTEQVAKTNEEIQKGIQITTKYGDKQEELSDRELTEKISNLKQQVFDIQSKGTSPSDSVNFFNQAMATFLKKQLGDAQAEANLRSTFRRQVDLYGEDRALSMHSAFSEDRLRSYVEQADEAKKTRETLQSIERRLAPIFKNKG